MDVIRQALVTIANGGNGMTTRHLFYRAVAAGIVDKTEAEYDGTVARLAVDLRRSGDIPYGKIVDGSRLYTAPTTYDGIEDALADTASFYRRSYWNTADRRLEVWCEKDAIRALIQDTTWALAVPLMVTRGFASESIVQSLAEDTKESGKPRIILSLNDYDPAPSDKFYSEQVALTREQVTKFKLPTTPTKIKDNTHASKFSDVESVELDEMDPTILAELLRTAIERHIDGQALEVMREAERANGPSWPDWPEILGHCHERHNPC